jgi:hypothetical protein
MMDEIRSVILLTFLSAIGGLLFGYDTGVVSGAMLLIEEDSRIEADTVWKELIVSATVRSVSNPIKASQSFITLIVQSSFI